MSQTELATLSPKQISTLVESVPSQKRPALGKALKAASQHMKDMRRDYDKAFDLASAMVRNWWLLGRELKALDIKTGRPKENSNGRYHFNISDLGLSKIQSSRCQKLADLSESELKEQIASARDEVKWKLPSVWSSITHVSQNSGENEWYTPPAILDAARGVLGGIDMDPASSDVAQEQVQAASYCTVEDSGLEKNWKGNVWMNPPYAKGLIEPFMERLCEQYEAGNVISAIVLVNNATDTKWFQVAARVATAICFTSGRVRFIDPRGKPSGSPLQGQALLYFGKATEKFAQEFEQFGFVGRVF